MDIKLIVLVVSTHLHISSHVVHKLIQYHNVNYFNKIGKIYFKKEKRKFNGTPEKFFIILLGELQEARLSLPPDGILSHYETQT